MVLHILLAFLKLDKTLQSRLSSTGNLRSWTDKNTCYHPFYMANKKHQMVTDSFIGSLCKCNTCYSPFSIFQFSPILFYYIQRVVCITILKLGIPFFILFLPFWGIPFLRKLFRLYNLKY